MGLFRTRVLLLAGLIIGVAAWGQDDKGLDRLRQDVDALRREVSERFNAQDRLQIHGFVSQGYMKSTDNNYLTDSDDGSFDFWEVGINMRAQLTDSLSVGVQLIGRDQGEVGNGDVEIDWAFGDYNYRDWFGIRIGRVKIPNGMYNEERDIDAVRVPILLPTSVYPEDYRDQVLTINGVSVYGHVALDKLGSLSYVAYIGGMDLDDDDNGLKRQLDANPLWSVDNQDVDYVWGGALTYETPFNLTLFASYFRMVDYTTNLTTTMAGNMAFGLFDVVVTPDPPGPPIVTVVPDPPTAIRTENKAYVIRTFGAEYTWKNLKLAAEWQQSDGASHLFIPGLPPIRRGSHPRGYYAMATYQVTDDLAVGCYYSQHYLNRKDKDGDSFANNPAGEQPRHRAKMRDVSFFARYDITDRWSVKAEYHFMKGTSQCLSTENLDEYGELHLTEDWKLFLMKVSYNF